jgi:hypothetical protein
MRRLVVVGALLLWACWAAPVGAVDCTTSDGCAGCSFADGAAECTFVQADGYCECTVTVHMGRTACAYDGICDYTGGTGGGTGGGGGGGTTCSRPAGGWCPPECSSCGTVYWY